MVEITFIAHDFGSGNAFYQLQIRTMTDLFGEDAHIRPLCYGTNDLKNLIDQSIPILRHSANNGDIGILLIGRFSYMANVAIRGQAERIAKRCGSQVYFHEHEFYII